MLKVFLVEDEYAMRERMKKNMMWEANGFCLVGEAGDGELAYPLIQELQPDILITDIRMPFMDGLQLTQLVKQSIPDLKVLILSGYDEFEYAKQAIHLGVTDYLLKPISAKKLLEALNKVAALIETERLKEANYEKSQIWNQEKYQLEKKKFFNSLISGRASIQVLIEKAKELELDLTATAYKALILKINNLGKISLEDEEMLKQEIDNYFSMHPSLLVFECTESEYAILLKGSELSIMDLERVLIKQLTEILNVIPYYIGVGQRVSRMSEIPHAFETATQALASRYLLKDTPILYYHKLKDDFAFEGNIMIDLHDVRLPKVNHKQLESFLYNGHEEEVRAFTESYFKSLTSSLDSYLFRQYLMVDIYFMMTSFCHEMSISQESIFGEGQNLNLLLKDKQLFKDMIENWMKKCLKVRDSAKGKGHGKLIAQVKNYLQQNYNKEGLSLNQVADYVNISPSHLSMLFSQETGQTFISYLTHIRMEKAKELLRCSKMKTLEIGYEVGYKDAHYFSSLFKKTQNCTPKEYRSQHHEMD